MSKIQASFNGSGRKLFESEKPLIDAFNSKYKGKDRMSESIKIGKVFKTLSCGRFGYSVWSGDTAAEVSPSQADVEQQESFVEWSSIVLPIEEARKLTRDLNQTEVLRDKTIDDAIRVAQYEYEEARSRMKSAKSALDELKKKK